MRSLCALLLCLVVLTGRVRAGDPPDGSLVDCGSEKVAVFVGSVSPDGRYAFGWTIRPGRNQTPVSWAAYDPDKPYDMLEAHPYDPDKPDSEYQLVDGVIDLRAHQFTSLDSTFPYWPHRNHGNLGVAWSHGAQSGKFAVINNDARFATWNLWLVVTAAANVRVVDLAGPAGKSVDSFLRRQVPKKYDRYAVIYEDVSYGHGVARVNFEAAIPKSLDDKVVQGVVTVALPAGTITGVRGR